MKGLIENLVEKNEVTSDQNFAKKRRNQKVEVVSFMAFSQS